jgi:hypothetical protein
VEVLVFHLLLLGRQLFMQAAVVAQKNLAVAVGQVVTVVAVQDHLVLERLERQILAVAVVVV